MDILSFLRESTERFGPVGYEQGMAKWLKTQFEPYCDEVHIDAMSNVIRGEKADRATNAGKPPVLMLCAHMDEIALLVTEILKDGSLRIRRMGGVRPAHPARGHRHRAHGGRRAVRRGRRQAAAPADRGRPQAQP